MYVQFRWCIHSQSDLLIQSQNLETPEQLCVICSKLTIKTPDNNVTDVVLVTLSLTLNIFHIFFLVLPCFHYSLWTSKCWLGWVEKVLHMMQSEQRSHHLTKLMKQRAVVFIVNLEHISNLVLVFLLLALTR